LEILREMRKQRGKEEGKLKELTLTHSKEEKFFSSSSVKKEEEEFSKGDGASRRTLLG